MTNLTSLTNSTQGEIIEERLTFPSGKLTLSGILAYPESAEPARAVLLCSPHPHFAGDMNNNVVRALARHLAADGLTLRFDYRGVGESEIKLPPQASAFDYWHDIEETKDYRDALDDVQAAASELRRVSPELPLTVIGYSFGAVTALRHGGVSEAVHSMVGISPPLTRVGLDFLAGCPKPCLVLCGKNDFLYSPEEISKLKRVVGPAVAIELLEGQDHFFRGEEECLCERVAKFVGVFGCRFSVVGGMTTCPTRQSQIENPKSKIEDEELVQCNWMRNLN